MILVCKRCGSQWFYRTTGAGQNWRRRQRELGCTDCRGKLRPICRWGPDADPDRPVFDLGTPRETRCQRLLLIANNPGQSAGYRHWAGQELTRLEAMTCQSQSR